MRSIAPLFLSLILVGCSFGGSPSNGASSSSASSHSSSLMPEEMITVSSPARDEVVQSPLTVTGMARGNWFFEASAPIKLLDADGNQIAVSYIQAQGEWMTTDFVPFVGTLTFQTDAVEGTLVLEKDNPSGLPEYAASISIPVRFE